MVYIEIEFSYLEKQKHEVLKDTNPKVQQFHSEVPAKKYAEGYAAIFAYFLKNTP